MTKIGAGSSAEQSLNSRFTFAVPSAGAGGLGEEDAQHREGQAAGEQGTEVGSNCIVNTVTQLVSSVRKSPRKGHRDTLDASGGC